jgi:hypothetical protein
MITLHPGQTCVSMTPEQFTAALLAAMVTPIPTEDCP